MVGPVAYKMTFKEEIPKFIISDGKGWAFLKAQAWFNENVILEKVKKDGRM